MPYDRKFFFDNVRANLFSKTLTQDQVDGMNFLLEVWEQHFEQPNPRDGTKWLAYALATFFHETDQRMQPIEEYGKGSGASYGQPTGPHGHRYYGRGHVQLTWEVNYKNGEKYIKDRYNVDAPLHREPHRMLHGPTSALVSYDGMIHGWFTGVGLPKYFNSTVEDARNARRIVNGTDKMDLIAGYYTKFKAALEQVPAAQVTQESKLEAQLPDLPKHPHMPDPHQHREKDDG